MIARSVAPFLGGKGRTVKPSELMNWPKEPDEQASPEEVTLMLMALAGKKKGK